MCRKRVLAGCSAALAILFALTSVATQSARAQTFKVIHNFTNGADGSSPWAGLTRDPSGNLYGTAHAGGTGNGTVFKLTRTSSGWLFNPLYSFKGGQDGNTPGARVILGPNGTLYGTTEGGGANGNGTVFNLRPPGTAPRSALSSWTKTILYSFTGGTDSYTPMGDLTFDQSGNLYGTTSGSHIYGQEGFGGYGDGSVYELVHSSGTWTINVVYGFTGGMDGSNPEGGVIFGQDGNLYGTTAYGGSYGDGNVFELTSSGPGWTEQTLHSFDLSDGFAPQSGLVSDQSGNLFGATSFGGANGGGTVFELTPSGGGWTFSSIYDLPKGSGGPFGTLAIDAAGNLFGANYGGGSSYKGNIFKLAQVSGVWTYTDLYDFTGGADGGGPQCSPVVDAMGNIYGTTSYGGTYGDGVVWEITPAMYYSTNFPLTENPISENGHWTNGLATGLDWKDCQTTTHFAFGTQDGSGGYDDSTCVVNGSWGPVQTATGTIHVTTQTAYQEVELRLHTTITPHSITGYEINLSVGSNRYAQVVRWNGPLNDFTYLDSRSTGAINDGDVLKATIDGSGVITVYINDVQQFQVADTTFTTGNPGMGFYSAGGTNSNFGFSSFTATAGE